MTAMSHSQVCNFLGIHPKRLEHWIGKGQLTEPSLSTERRRSDFQPPMMTVGRGKKREWTPDEVLRLAVFVKLVDEFGIAPSIAGGMTIVPMAASEKEDFFVAWRAHDDAVRGFWSDSVKRENIGRFLRGEVYDSQGQTPQWVDPEAVPASAIVIDPAPIVRALRAAWEAEGLDWE